jgi:hypothetical protein
MHAHEPGLIGGRASSAPALMANGSFRAPACGRRRAAALAAWDTAPRVSSRLLWTVVSRIRASNTRRQRSVQRATVLRILYPGWIRLERGTVTCQAGFGFHTTRTVGARCAP